MIVNTGEKFAIKGGLNGDIMKPNEGFFAIFLK